MALDRDTTFTWYGHSAFEVRTPGGKTIVLDPFFANPKSPATADSIQRCDLLLVSHGHFDHMADAVWNPVGETTLYLGEPNGFVVEVENGFRFYFAGDTTVFSDMRLIRELYAPEVAFLPIGDHYTMGPKGAAMAAGFLGVKHVVPMHYGTFPILTGTPDQLRSELAARGITDVEVHAPEPGGTVS